MSSRTHHKHKREKSMTSFKAISAQGVRFFKYGIKRKPQITLVRIQYEGKLPEQIIWGPEGRDAIALEDIKLVAHGCVTRAFVGKIDDSVDPHCCFSIIPLNSNKSLDLQAASPQVAQRWVRRLRKMVGQTSREAQILSNAVLAETLTPSFNGDSITSAPLDDRRPLKTRPTKTSKLSRHVKQASKTLLSKDVSTLKNGAYKPAKATPEDNQIFQSMFYRILRTHTEQQKADIRKIVNPKYLFNTIKKKRIPKREWESFISDEFGWALRSDMPISMSPFKMDPEFDSPRGEAHVESPAQKFLTMHNLESNFSVDDFQNCLDTMNILIPQDLVEECFDCIVEDGDFADKNDLELFFGYVWGPRVDRVKSDVLAWLETQINEDLESKMRAALNKGKRYSTLDLRLAFGEDKELSFMKKLYSRLLQEQEEAVELKREPASTISDDQLSSSSVLTNGAAKRPSKPFVMPFISTNAPPATVADSNSENTVTLDDNKIQVSDSIGDIITAPRSKAGTIVESIGDLTSESNEKFIRADNRIMENASSNESESKSTESSTKKRDPSAMIEPLNAFHAQRIDSVTFENLMHRKVIKSRKQDESDDESEIGMVRRTPSVLEAVRSASRSVPRRSPPPTASSVLTSMTGGKSDILMGGSNMPSDSLPKLPTPTPTYTKDSVLAVPESHDFDRRITEGAGSPMMDASYSRRLTEGAQILDPGKASSYPKVSVGLFDILDAQHSHNRENSDYSRPKDSRSSTLSRVAGNVVSRIPGLSQAHQVRLVSVTREKKNSEVKYCKLEQPTSTAVSASPKDSDFSDEKKQVPNPNYDWSFPREIWMCFTILSFFDTVSDIYMAGSVITKTFGWVPLLVLVFGFRGILISWVLPNYTPFYEFQINSWTMLSTWCPFSAIWHSAVPFPPKSSEELVQGLLHEFCVELILIPIFTVLYVPFLLYVLFDSMQWSVSIFEQRYIFWNTIHLFQCVPMFLTSIILFISGCNDHPVVLSLVLSALTTAKSVYVFRVHSGKMNEHVKQVQIVCE